MSVNKANNYDNNYNLYSSIGVGLIAGTAIGTSTAGSKPWIKDGGLSDEYVKKVKEVFLDYTPGVNKKDFEFKGNIDFDNYIDSIKNAKSIKDIASANIKYLYNSVGVKSLAEMKEYYKNCVELYLGNIDFSKPHQNTLDNLLDFRSAFKNADNLSDFKKVLKNWIKYLNPSLDFEELKMSIVMQMEETFKPVKDVPISTRIKQAFETCYDFNKNMFKKDVPEVSNEMLSALKRAANIISLNAGVKAAAIATMAFSGISYLIMTFTNNPNKNKKAD